MVARRPCGNGSGGAHVQTLPSYIVSSAALLQLTSPQSPPPPPKPLGIIALAWRIVRFTEETHKWDGERHDLEHNNLSLSTDLAGAKTRAGGLMERLDGLKGKLGQLHEAKKVAEERAIHDIEELRNEIHEKVR